MVLASTAEPEVDAYVENHLTIFLVRPVSTRCKKWLDENVSKDSHHFGSALVVEHRYITDLVVGMASDGLVLR